MAGAEAIQGTTRAERSRKQRVRRSPGRRVTDAQRSEISRALGRKRFIIMLTTLLFVFGLVMVASASSSTSLLAGGNPWGYLRKQLMYGVVGVGAMWLCLRMRLDLIRRFAWPMMLASGFLLFLVFVPGLGYTANGATRWLSVGPLQLQPSELVKIATVFYMADYLARAEPPKHWLFGFVLRRDARWFEPLGWLTPGGRALFLAMVIFLQHDLGTAMITAGVTLSLFLLVGTDWRVLFRFVGPAFGLVVISIVATPFRRDRFLAFLDPSKHAASSGYQLMQGLIAIGSGGPFGKGLGHSVQKIFYLPEAHTDMIFSIIAEELGLVGVAVVLVGFAALAVVGFRIAARATTRFDSLLAAGLTASLCGQAFLNVAGVVGVLPLTGVPLPLVSYGGSSLIVTFASLGLLANIAVAGHTPDTEPLPEPLGAVEATPDPDRGGWDDGTSRSRARGRRAPA